MERLNSLDQQLNFITVEILEALDIYPNAANTDLLEKILYKYMQQILEFKYNNDIKD